MRAILATFEPDAAQAREERSSHWRDEREAARAATLVFANTSAEASPVTL